MDYQATTKYARMSPRKLRFLAKSIRGLKAEMVMPSLQSIPQPGTKLLAKTIASAIANAKQKQVDIKNLWIRTIEIMEGPVFKRWHAVSRGSAHSYKKRMAHIKIVLSDKEINK